MDFFALIFIVFFIFVLCSLCGFCCKKNEEGAVFTTPVVITSATHQPPGQTTSYPIHTEQTTIITPSHQPVGMPMPFNQSGYSPYPPASAGSMPYPPANQPGYQPSYPPASAPYPTMNPASMNPPSYNEIMGNSALPPSQPNAMNTDFYQKQSPYNPGYPQ